MSLSELMVDIPTQHEQNVFGQFDSYAKKIERTFHVTLIARDGNVKILGEQIAADKAKRVLTQLTELSKRNIYFIPCCLLIGYNIKNLYCFYHI